MPVLNRFYIILFRLLFLTGILLFSKTGSSQLSFFYNESSYKLPAGTLTFYTDSSKDRSWQRYTEIENKLIAYPASNFNISYQNKKVWIKIDFSKISHADNLNYLMIRNPHINYISAWLIKDGEMVKAFEPTGDRTNFSTRPIQFSDFLFPLPEDSLDHYQLVMMLDKRNEMIHIPVHIFTEGGLLHYIRIKNWTAGLFIGISFFLFLFNLFLYVNMREKMYVYYGLYIVLGFLYIFSDMGFTFMYLFPDYPLLSDFTRPISITLATPIYLLFSMELLETRKNFPGNYKWMVRIIIGYILLLISSLILAADTGVIRVYLSGLSYVVLNFLMLSNVFIGWKSMKKKVPYSIYIIIASTVLIILLIFFSLFLSGNLPDNFINRNMMRIAITTEIAILTLVLSHRFKKYKVSSEKLLRQVNEQEEKIFKTVTDYQEKELQRLSSLLHDSVGARLSGLRYNLENANKYQSERLKIDNAITEVSDLADEVRSFSHTLSPILLQKKGLKDALGQFIDTINKNGQLQIQFEMIGSMERTSFRYEILIHNIIQELIQNIIKHARATEAIVQLIMEESLVSIYIEDNGRGFNNTEIKDGLGFTQIKQLVIFVNGRLSIDTAEGKGSRISIEFTTLPDERKHPDSDS